jgi:pantoate--beta-alanine ligase
VAQIVSRLFQIVNPTRAYFGEKDFQQIAVIRRMVQLEGFDLEIVPCPIQREADGLALSSRNVRLTSEQRQIAPNIHRVLAESVEAKKAGASVSEVKNSVIEKLNAIKFLEVEYYEIVDALTMQPITEWLPEGQSVGCITVYCGDVRLIDNIKY